jgi:acetylornithine/succinyldiaminopimelate/putrescine aminotransferase
MAAFFPDGGWGRWATATAKVPTVTRIARPPTRDTTERHWCAWHVVCLVIEEQDLLANVERIANLFRERLHAVKQQCDVIHDIRILGTMIGIELSIDGADVVQACLDRNLLVNCTQGKVIRLLPAMTLTPAEVEEGCDILAEAILDVAGRQ